MEGEIRNPYGPSVFGVGITGNKYPTYDKDNGKANKEYSLWYSVLRRSFSEYYKNHFPTYRDVFCSNEWLYYNNFYEWIHKQSNYEVLKGTKYDIDKDILFKGNLEYAPEKCTLVPRKVNKMMVNQSAHRGNLPIGVVYNKKKDCYSVSCNNDGKNVHLNNVKSLKKAFDIYKNYKESVIKRTAKEEYSKGTITEQCYNALMNYSVEITD